MRSIAVPVLCNCGKQVETSSTQQVYCCGVLQLCMWKLDPIVSVDPTGDAVPRPNCQQSESKGHLTNP
jgi:hypothetical protein